MLFSAVHCAAELVLMAFWTDWTFVLHCEAALSPPEVPPVPPAPPVEPPPPPHPVTMRAHTRRMIRIGDLPDIPIDWLFTSISSLSFLIGIVD